jgi:hypothetical protein
MSNRNRKRNRKSGFTVNFVFECETSGAIRYAEVAGTSDGTLNGAQHRGKVGTLYIRKAAFDGKYPKELIVRVRSAKQSDNHDIEV